MKVAKISLYVSAVLLFLGAAKGLAQANSTKLVNVFRSYVEEVQALKQQTGDSQDQHKKVNEFNTRWISILSNALVKADDSDPSQNQILSELLALQSSVGDYKAAERTGALLISKTADQHEKASLQMNDAEIKYMAYVDAPSAENFELAVKSFKDASINTDVSGHISTALGFLTKYAALLKMGNLPLQAIPVYESGALLIQKSASSAEMKDLAKQSVGTDGYSSFSEEWFLDAALDTAVASGQTEKAEELFNRIIKLPNLFWPATYHFFKYISTLDPEHGKKFQSAALQWIDNKHEDAWTPFLQFYLARSYFDDKNYIAAAHIYSKLLDLPIAQPMKSSLEEQSGGYAAEILYNLGYSLAKLGDTTQSAALFESFERVFPKDPRVELIPNKRKK